MNNRLNEFQEYLIREGHASKAYLYPLQKMFKDMGEIEFTQDNLNKYLTEFTYKYSAEYTNLLHKALRCYMQFTGLGFRIPNDLKVPKRKVASLSMDFIEKKLLPAVDVMNFENPLKVKAILYLMAYTGMRKSEVIVLRREKMNLKEGMLSVYLQKTKKEHTFLFPQKVAEKIQNYFLTESQQTNAFNLGATGVNYIFDKLKSHFKEEVRLFPHLFKKTAVTHLHKCGFSLKEISEMVGVSVTTLDKHYLDVDIEKIKQQYNDRIK